MDFWVSPNYPDLTLYQLLKPILFSLEPEAAHHLALGSLGLAEPFLPLLGNAFRTRDERLQREAFGLKFPNPIGLAAGLDKKGERVLSWEKLGFGFAELGTFTAKPQPGNEKPRVFRYPPQEALINRMGFPNPGSKEAASRLRLLKVRGRWPGMPVGINIGKSKVTPMAAAVEDYLESAEAFLPVADYLAVNVSSPNTPGLRELQDAKPLKRLLTALVRRAGRTPVLLKLAPDLQEKSLKEAANVALSSGCRGLIATNTTLSREGLPPGRYPEGGLSGHPLRERSTQVLASLAKFTKGRVPLIAVGGVFTAEDVRQKMDAGAALVQIYTGFIYEGPGLPSRLCRGLLQDPAFYREDPKKAKKR